jgi:phosphoribosylformylglycinamidine synthase PurS subunit
VKALAHIVTTFKSDIPNQHAQSILNSLRAANFEGITDLQLGKEFQIEIEVDNTEHAYQIVDQMCQQLLAHRVTDNYKFTIEFPSAAPDIDELIKELEADLNKVNTPKLHALLVLCESKEMTDFDCAFFAALIARYHNNGQFDAWLKEETNLEVLDRWTKVIDKIFGRANKCIFKNKEGDTAAYLINKIIR